MVRPLVLVRGNVPRRGVPSDAVVGRLDVLDDARLRRRAGGVALLVNQFLLERCEVLRITVLLLGFRRDAGLPHHPGREVHAARVPLGRQLGGDARLP